MTVQSNILLINRDKYFLAQTARALQEEGFVVHTAMEMRGALSILSSQAISLIISDKDLQDIGGSEFLSFIKNDPLREKIPFMLYVSLNDQGRPRRMFELGAIDYVVYPIDLQAFVNRINEALGDAGSPSQPTRAATAATPAKSSTAAPRNAAVSQNVAASHTPADQTKVKFETPLDVEISRDGVIWLPSKITQFFRQKITMETSMMGKSGVSVMIRIKEPEESFILNGVIKSITFNDFQKPAGMEINIKEDENWHRVMFNAEIGEDDSAAQANKMDKSISSMVREDAASPQTNEISDFAKDSDVTGKTPSQRDISYDKRFYQSLIGKQLDNYRAMSVIGIGNMGGVLQGWDVALEREVALKIISYKLSSKEAFRKLFIKEARVISKLNHPNIAQIYNIGISNDILFYAMEFIDGITLKDIISKDGSIEIKRGLDILMAVCGALEVIFENSIVHRDIKPANLMITRPGVVKVVDFGVAKTHESRSGGGGKKGLYGTPLYMSPEQIAGLAIDHRSDMYALGATFYHAFCGAPPFQAKDLKQLLRHHLNTPLTPACERNPKIPQSLSRIIDRMMAKDPFERYKSFNEIAQEIKKLVL